MAWAMVLMFPYVNMHFPTPASLQNLDERVFGILGDALNHVFIGNTPYNFWQPRPALPTIVVFCPCSKQGEVM